MNTRVIPASNPDSLMVAKKILDSGGLVAFPTDTVYGLAANINNPAAIDMIFVAKKRPHDKAIPVLLAGIEDLEKVSIDIPEMALNLAAAFWPGALTLVVPKHPNLPPNLSGESTVGARVPDHDFVLSLLKVTGPLAVSSANISEELSPLDATSVLVQLGGRIHLIIDGGITSGGLPSTVVDCTGMEPKILRSGPISFEMINNSLGGRKKF